MLYHVQFVKVKALAGSISYLQLCVEKIFLTGYDNYSMICFNTPEVLQRFIPFCLNKTIIISFFHPYFFNLYQYPMNCQLELELYFVRHN